jgi:hypothetical protein
LLDVLIDGDLDLWIVAVLHLKLLKLLSEFQVILDELRQFGDLDLCWLPSKVLT